METQEFTDYQRKQIADKGYASDIWKKGNLVKIDNRKTYVGTVAKVVRGRDDVKGDDPNGLDAVAIKDEKTKTIRIIFQGSKGRKDWRDNDILLVLKAAAKIKGPTGQLRAAAGFTKKVFDENKGYSIEIYGHSLGSMDGQYAIASLDAEQTTRLKGAWLYEGPNMYRILNRAEKEQVNMCRNKINNYLDPRDLASFGYSTRQYAVGSVFWVDSIRTGGKNTKDRIVNQHMWGGYQFTKDGKLIRLYQNQLNWWSKDYVFRFKEPLNKFIQIELKNTDYAKIIGEEEDIANGLALEQKTLMMYLHLSPYLVILNNAQTIDIKKVEKDNQYTIVTFDANIEKVHLKVFDSVIYFDNHSGAIKKIVFNQPLLETVEKVSRKSKIPCKSTTEFATWELTFTPYNNKMLFSSFAVKAKLNVEIEGKTYTIISEENFLRTGTQNKHIKKENRINIENPFFEYTPPHKQGEAKYILTTEEEEFIKQ